MLSIGQNNIEVGGKFVQNDLRWCFSVPDFRKRRPNRYFKITLASLLNRQGQVLARSTGTTFSYKRSVKDSAGERVTLLPGTTLLHINRPLVKMWNLNFEPYFLLFAKEISKSASVVAAAFLYRMGREKQWYDLHVLQFYSGLFFHDVRKNYYSLNMLKLKVRHDRISLPLFPDKILKDCGG